MFVRKRCLSGGDNMRTAHSGRVFVTKTSNVKKMLMKLETQTFDLYAKLAIAFATVIRLCAPFRCQRCFQMSNSCGDAANIYL